jgi:hypothetical protein
MFSGNDHPALILSLACPPSLKHLTSCVLFSESKCQHCACLFDDVTKKIAIVRFLDVQLITRIRTSGFVQGILIGSILQVKPSRTHTLLTIQPLILIPEARLGTNFPLHHSRNHDYASPGTARGHTPHHLHLSGTRGVPSVMSGHQGYLQQVSPRLPILANRDIKHVSSSHQSPSCCRWSSVVLAL